MEKISVKILPPNELFGKFPETSRKCRETSRHRQTVEEEEEEFKTPPPLPLIQKPQDDEQLCREHGKERIEEAWHQFQLETKIKQHTLPVFLSPTCFQDFLARADMVLAKQVKKLQSDIAYEKQAGRGEGPHCKMWIEKLERLTPKVEARP